MKEDKRRFKRYRCEIAAEFAMYTEKTRNGKGVIKNAGLGGIRLQMKTNPVPEAVFALKTDPKRLSKYVDYNRIILDPEENPLIRVVHSRKDSRTQRTFNVGARFMVKPGMRDDLD